MKIIKNSWIIALFSVLSVVYVLWSQAELHKYRGALEIEKKRVYNIADNLELWKKIFIEYNGKFIIEDLDKDQRDIVITKIDNKSGLVSMAENDQFYIMYYNEPDEKRKKELSNYASALVLNNYFYVITDIDGRVKEMFWDKP